MLPLSHFLSLSSHQIEYHSWLPHPQFQRNHMEDLPLSKHRLKMTENRVIFLSNRYKHIFQTNLNAYIFPMTFPSNFVRHHLLNAKCHKAKIWRRDWLAKVKWFWIVLAWSKVVGFLPHRFTVCHYRYRCIQHCIYTRSLSYNGRWAMRDGASVWCPLSRLHTLDLIVII